MTRALTFVTCIYLLSTNSAYAVELPRLHDDSFSIDVLGQFRPTAPNLCFGLAISDGEQGLPRGLFMTSGPLADRTQLFFMSAETREIGVFSDALVSNETAVIAEDDYGTGLLVSEIKNGRIVRLSSEGDITEFVTAGFSEARPENDLFGPAQLTYAPDVLGRLKQALYVTDFSSGRVFRVDPDGTTLPVTPTLDSNARSAVGPSVVKGIAVFLGRGSRFKEGIPLVVTSWNSVRSPGTGLMHYIDLNRSESFAVDADHVWQETRRDNISQVQLLSTAASVDGGEYVYIPSEQGEGSISRMNAEGVMEVFVSGIYAAHVVEDDKNVFGGGLITCARSEDDTENLILRIHR